jgi:hypothetical protein
MLFGETVAVYCENHTEHNCALCGQNAFIYNAFIYDNPDGKCKCHWALNDLFAALTAERDVEVKVSKEQRKKMKMKPQKDLFPFEFGLAFPQVALH